MRLLLLATAFVALAGTAHAQRSSKLTALKLMEICAAKDPRQVEGCTAYIDGVADAVSSYQRARPANGSKGAALPGYICIPAETTGVQLRQAVTDWFLKHKDQATRQAGDVVIRALDGSYPCPGEAPKP